MGHPETRTLRQIKRTPALCTALTRKLTVEGFGSYPDPRLIRNVIRGVSWRSSVRSSYPRTSIRP